jgi:hypothetical protein
MRQKLRSHVTFANVVSLIALSVALGGTTYAATGGNFILGQANTANAPTRLSSGVTGTTSAFKVTNTSTGRAITAVGTSGGYGVYASGGQQSTNTAAIHGESTGGNAVEGISGKNTASGVYGENDSTGLGVAGRSTNGTGVLGESSSGWAFNASGNTTQTRNANGFVKAMAFVDPVNSSSDPIRQCFNSQLQASQATSDDCGFTYSETSAGRANVNFGFRVLDRFISATPTASIVSVGVNPLGESDPSDPNRANKVEVSTDVESGSPVQRFRGWAPYWITVY